MIYMLMICCGFVGSAFGLFVSLRKLGIINIYFGLGSSWTSLLLNKSIIYVSIDQCVNVKNEKREQESQIYMTVLEMSAVKGTIQPKRRMMSYLALQIHCVLSKLLVSNQ